MSSPLKKLKVTNDECIPDTNNQSQTKDVENKQYDIAYKVLSIEQKQCEDLLKVKYANDISYIYNPVDYALELHKDFLEKYCYGNQPVLLLGMNPGPWGMSQTGVSVFYFY